MSKGKVLVTGCNGFTGHYVVEALKQEGYSVAGIGFGQSTCLLDSYDSLDLCDKTTLFKCVQKVSPDYVIHLAAKAFVADEDVEGFYQTNLIGTRYLLEALVQLPQQPKKTILASSANVYGNAQSGQLSETALVAPANDYAVSKLSMEYMAHLFDQKLNLTITRPFNYTGVGQSENFVIPKIVKAFKVRESCLSLGNLNVYREFNDVRNIANFYVQLLRVSENSTYNLCTGRGYALKDVLNYCQEITGHCLEVQVNPQFVRSNEVKELIGNPSRLYNAIGQPEQFFDLKQTLSWMLNA